MPSIYNSTQPITEFPNRFVSPYGNDLIIPIYSSVPVINQVTGECLPCVICEKRNVFLDSYSSLLASNQNSNFGGGGAGGGGAGGGGAGGGGAGGQTPVTITLIDPYYVLADYIIITYYFDATGGRDLDTRTQIINPVQTNIVGFCEPNDADPYLFWGGDNTGYGLESCYVDLTKFSENSVVEIKCGANWFGERASGNMRLQIITYKGGTIQQEGFAFINVGGQKTASREIPYNIFNLQAACVYGNEIGVLSYNKQTNRLLFSYSP
jgi:hypothetical protein